MGTYNSAVITTAGQSLLARAIADNLPFYFTSAKTTEYVVPSGTSAASLTELPNIKQSEEITSATVSGGNQVVTSVRFDNTEITLNYSINTIGVYARVGTDTEETLLAVITAITADVMPSYSAANPVSYVYSINLAISNASNINIIVAPTGAPNYAEFNELSAEVEALDAEVQNARIGADGVTYPTLGDAIRTNDSALKNHLSDVISFQYSGVGNAPLVWELGAINNQGGEEDNTAMVRTGFYIMRKGDIFVCTQTNLRVFYYDLNKTFKSTLYSVVANQVYTASEDCFIRFRAGYTSSYGNYNYYNQYLSVKNTNTNYLYESYTRSASKHYYINDNMFEIGSIGIANDAYTYRPTTMRVRTKIGVSFHLMVGDVVRFKSPITRFCPFYTVNGGSPIQVGWQTSDYTVSVEGDYVFVLSEISGGSEIAPTSAKEFSRALLFDTQTQINDVAMWNAINEAITLAEDAGGVSGDARATAIVESVNQAVDGNDLIFVHITDSHVGQTAMSLDRARRHFAKVMSVAKAVGADFLIHTGDMIQGAGSTTGNNDKQRYQAYVGSVGKHTIPFMWCQGNPNHDFGIVDSESENGYALNRDMVLALAGRFGKWHMTKAVFNDSDTIRTYYYFDLPIQNVRCIILDSDDYNTARQNWGISAKQIAWFSDVLADAKSKDLPVIIFSHMPPSDNLMPSGIETKGGAEIMSALATFTSSGGTVLAFIYGHVHWDNYYYDSTNKIPYISCTCDLPVASTEQYIPTWGTKVVPTRTIDTITEYAFDVYVINPSTKRTQIFRYGAGENRSYTY